MNALRMSEITIAVLLALCAGLHAEEIRINFGDTSAGGNWNQTQADTSSGQFNMSNLTDYNSGSSTSVDLAGSGFFQNSAVGLWTPTQTLDWVLPSVGDSFISGGTLPTLTLSGLSESTYKVEMLSSIHTFFSYPATYEVNGSSADGTYTGSAVPAMWDPGARGTQDSNWMIWDAVDASGGTISIGLSGGNTAVVNALRITSIPEPVSAALICLFGCALLAIRRVFLI